MKKLLAIVAAVLMALPAPAYGHRLDEYLQATILSVDTDRVEGSMRLVPGVAVGSGVIARIDTDGDGLISATEELAYARRVLGDLALSVDGHRVGPRLLSVKSK